MVYELYPNKRKMDVITDVTTLRLILF
jgi:hypothetical protein